MHAVMALNKEDGGNRQCMMVQMTEATKQEPKKNICRDITRERVKRAIEKYDYATGFQYLRVGESMDERSLLEGNLPTYEVFAEYVYYLVTGAHLPDKNAIDPKRHFVGSHGGREIYLIYRQDYDTLKTLALTLDFADEIAQSKGRKIVFAPNCFIDPEDMQERRIEFVSLPYELFRRFDAD